MKSDSKNIPIQGHNTPVNSGNYLQYENDGDTRNAIEREYLNRDLERPQFLSVRTVKSWDMNQSNTSGTSSDYQKNITKMLARR